MKTNSIVGCIVLGVGAWLLFGNLNLVSTKIVGLLIAGLGIAFLSNKFK